MVLGDTTDESTQTPWKSPSLMDVLTVKAMLLKCFKLPRELIDVIMDQAEYWPHTTAYNDFGGKPRRIEADSNEDNVFLLRSIPLGFTEPPASPDAYSAALPEPKPFKTEHPVEKYQEWVGSPDCMLTHPARKIVFTFVSKDQGWGGAGGDQGTYHGSWTWFDIGLERFDAGDDCHIEGNNNNNNPDNSSAGHSLEEALPLCSLRSISPTIAVPDPGPPNDPKKFHFDLLPSDRMIQSNVVAETEWKKHVVEWSWTDNVNPDSVEAAQLQTLGRGKASGDGEFVRGLKLGDVVAVWGKARFPWWRNTVQSVQMDVYWAV